MKLTPWFNAKVHSPARDGWYDCKKCNARHYFKEGLWYRDKKSLKFGPMLINKMHWRGLTRPISGMGKLLKQVEQMVQESGRPEGFDAQAWLVRWMKTPLASLDGKCPSEMMKTKDDQELVASLLAKMQSGSYA